MTEQCRVQIGRELGWQREHSPWIRLRTVLFEVGKKGSVREMLEARGVVAHDVVRSWQVEGDVAVAVGSLVRAGDVAQEGGRSVARQGAFGDPGDSRGVIASVGDGGIGDVVGERHQRGLGHESTVFEVAVGNGSREVCRGHQSLLHREGEGVAPQVSIVFGVEVDPAHAHFGSVSGPQQRRLLGDDLSQVGRAVAETCRE